MGSLSEAMPPRRMRGAGLLLGGGLWLRTLQLHSMHVPTYMSLERLNFQRGGQHSKKW